MCIMSLLFLVVIFVLTAIKMQHKIMKLSQAPVLLAMVASAVLSIVIVMVFGAGRRRLLSATGWFWTS